MVDISPANGGDYTLPPTPVFRDSSGAPVSNTNPSTQVPNVAVVNLGSNYTNTRRARCKFSIWEANAGANYAGISMTTGAIEIGTNGAYATIIYAGAADNLVVRANGIINMPRIPTYVDDGAAGAGGLVTGDIYRTAANVLMFKA